MGNEDLCHTKNTVYMTFRFSCADIMFFEIFLITYLIKAHWLLQFEKPTCFLMKKALAQKVLLSFS